MAIPWKVLGGVSAVAAGVLANKALSSGWRAVTGNDPPSNPESPETEWIEAIAYAVVSGALMGVARMLATRKAAAYYRNSTGHLPPNLESVT